ncbi:decaprenyl-phosphate phosphoribosyltransferase [Streptomonospora nanhaiensis]|uniref:Decaprenyl-phosphate phosphoribosyltransferase n=2 Tax=Streptomonospora nanhaiensis TaxID=1323731 RepID=A0A853BMT0_9ACTN|nr:decaprenyl-phosphate phosphoribosyltransferase [Streptomonospora nanhaiensis]NYI96024.1 decaprenyl-phosphate phosphoribosyltransferase [Streptomonospora nanhaiensis]
MTDPGRMGEAERTAPQDPAAAAAGPAPALAPAPRPRSGRRAPALLRAARPRQWLKNLLVFAAPGTAGLLTDPGALAWSGAAFVLFCAASSGTYLLNDARDAERDRLHEHKRRRPVAAGEVSVRTAVAAGAVLVAAVPAAVLATGNWPLLAVLTGYLLLTGAYTLGLKNVTVVDLVAVAGCHVLRAVAGGAAIGAPLTSWFLIVVSLGALLVVTGKREAELRTPGGARTRDTLARYSLSYLAQVRTMASAAMIVTYCLWALETPTETAHRVVHGLSIVPFIAVVLRYHLLVDRGVGEEPEEIALRDRPLQLCAAALLALIALGVYWG